VRVITRYQAIIFLWSEAFPDADAPGKINLRANE
jgi:hypothetical protein